MYVYVYLKEVARNAAADIYTAMERMACNKSRWKAVKFIEILKAKKLKMANNI
jgi:hypothetical protein